MSKVTKTTTSNTISNTTSKPSGKLLKLLEKSQVLRKVLLSCSLATLICLSSTAYASKGMNLTVNNDSRSTGPITIWGYYQTSVQPNGTPFNESRNCATFDTCTWDFNVYRGSSVNGTYVGRIHIYLNSNNCEPGSIEWQDASNGAVVVTQSGDGGRACAGGSVSPSITLQDNFIPASPGGTCPRGYVHMTAANHPYPFTTGRYPGCMIRCLGERENQDKCKTSMS